MQVVRRGERQGAGSIADRDGAQTAAGALPCLEKQSSAPRLCEIGRGNKAVVAAADDDDIEAFRHDVTGCPR